MVVGVLRFGQGAFEYDFRKLSTQGPVDPRSEAFDKDQDKLFGRWPHPTVVVTDSENDVALLKTAIRRADARAPATDVVGQMLSVQDLLPGTIAEQKRKLGVLDQIRKLTDDPAMQLLDDKDRKQLADVRPPSSLRVLHAEDLPPAGPAPVHRGRRHHRPGAAAVPARTGVVDLRRPGPAANGGRAAAGAAGRRARGADLGQRRDLRGHDPVDPDRGAAGHHHLVLGGAAAGAAAGAPAEGRPVRDRARC